MKTGIITACTAFLLAGTAFSEPVLTDSGNTIETITSLDQIELIVRNTQWDFWQLVPPATDDPFYLHSERIVRVVDWNSKDWPKPLLKQMYGEMISVGAYGLEYPFYRLTVIEDRSGDIVYFNVHDEEVWRTPAPKDYNPYLFGLYKYGAESVDELTDQQQLFGRSSNVGTELILIPLKIASLYEKQSFIDTRVPPLAIDTPSLLTSSSLSMTTMSLPPPPGGSGTSTNTISSTNAPATLTFSVPLNFGSGYAEIFQCTNLIDVVSWNVGVEAITVTPGTDLIWTDATSTNIPCRYYILNDPSIDTDFDGISDGREIYVLLTDPVLSDTSGDGLLDGWLVLYGLDPLSFNALDDSDNDGFSNLEEQEKGTDPTQADSSGDTGTVATIRYYYDEDDRLTDFFCGTEVAQKTILTAAHNISEEISTR
ncbi:MAG: hypothetical protein JXR23_06390 [Pontiellaceae bacterium]|nr:hypothetical protein [Pontiellaceae bacterium]